jgi:hypothetical protein
MNFIPGRAQDAAPTIRGFRYQIQLTVLRWLDLCAGEILVLECGEDIDRIICAKDRDLALRELEQVKARERAVTLRSPDVVAALANYAGHLKSNPGAAIRFRFTTTAEPGWERQSPLGKRSRGIEVWRSLQCQPSWNDEQKRISERLASLLRELRCPKDYPPNSWGAFTDILNGQGVVSFATYVASFEWSCGSIPPDDLDRLLLERLSALPGDQGPEDPSRQQRLDQLTNGVLKLLSESGAKSLSVELRDETLARPTLSEHDRARLSLLERRAKTNDEAVAELKTRLGQSLPMLFGHVAAEVGAVELSVVLPDIPPLAARLARRKETVEDLGRLLRAGVWLHLHGDFGRGKSHLGLLLAEGRGGVALGVSMRGLSAGAAEAGLAGLLGASDLVRRLLGNANGVVVLDDLPDFDSQSRFGMLLSGFVGLLLSLGRAVISTGRRALPQELVARAGSSLAIMATPSFSEGEARELFDVHGVNASLLTGNRVSTLNAACGGHPMLLTALARHLAARGQDADRALMDVLIASSHRTEIDLEMSRSVLATVEAPACQQLLYRLASVPVPLAESEIRLIASADPALPAPAGCIARLDGLWLRRLAGDRYEVSPLAKPLRKELSESVTRSVHIQAAAAIFRRRVVTPSEFMAAVSSLVMAGKTESAAVHLLRGCALWPRKAEGYSSLGVLIFFPPEHSHGLPAATELPLRAAQAVTAVAEGRRPDPYLTRLKEATRKPTPDTALGAVMAGSMIMTAFPMVPMAIAVLGAELIERFWSFPGLPSEMTEASSSYAEGTHILLTTACVRTWNDLDALLALLASLPEERRLAVMSNGEYRAGTQVTVWKPLWDADGEVVPGSKARLERIEKEAKRLGLVLIEAYAVAGQMVVLGEHEQNIDAMREKAAAAQERFASASDALAVIDVTLGNQLYLARRAKEGLPWLARGLSNRSHIVSLERGNRLVDALSAAWESDQDPSAYADELSGMLRDDEFIVSDVVCQMHAQIGILRWRQERRAEAFGHFEAAVTTFLALKDEMRTRQMGVGLGHALMYYITVLETGSPPDRVASGGTYIEPEPRMFSGNKEGMASLWRARQGSSMLLWMVGRLAACLGMSAVAATWIDRAMEAALAQKNPTLLILLTPRAASIAVKNTAWPELVEAVQIHGRARARADRETDQIGLLGDAMAFEPFEPPTDGKDQEHAETLSLLLIVHALACGLAERIVEGRIEALGALADRMDELAAQTQLEQAWKSLGTVMRIASAESMSDSQYREALAKAPYPSSETIRFLAHGLLSLRIDAELRQAAASQVGSLHRLVTTRMRFDLSPDEYARAVCQFWERAFQEARFRFGTPTEFARVLEDTAGVGVLARSKAILRGALQSLSVRMDDEVGVWVRTE